MEHLGAGPWEHGRGPDLKAKAGGQESRQWRWVDIAVRISLHTGPELGHPWWSGGWSGVSGIAVWGSRNEAVGGLT